MKGYLKEEKKAKIKSHLSFALHNPENLLIEYVAKSLATLSPAYLLFSLELCIINQLIMKNYGIENQQGKFR